MRVTGNDVVIGVTFWAAGDRGWIAISARVGCVNREERLAYGHKLFKVRIPSRSVVDFLSPMRHVDRT